jgi:O-antigen ligase
VRPITDLPLSSDRRSVASANGESSMPPERLGRIVDLVGLALLGGLIGWILLSAGVSGGDPLPAVLLSLAAAGALVASRLISSRLPSLVPAVLVVVAVVLAAATLPDQLTHDPTGRPLGYANANAAFFLQAAIGALMIATGAQVAAVRALGVVAAVALGAVIVALHAAAAAVLFLAAVLVALAARTARMARVVGAICAGLLGVAIVASVILGAAYSHGTEGGRVVQEAERALSTNRLALWHDALRDMRDHPAFGVGPGRFRLTSQTAQDPDTQWAHNEFLQTGAETGIIGVALLALAFLWAFARLWAGARLGPLTALGAAAVAALGIQASIDYILRFPEVTIAAAALLGVAIASTSAKKGAFPS